MSSPENQSTVLDRRRTSVSIDAGLVDAPQLPSSWKIARLGDSCEIKTGTVGFSSLPDTGSRYAGACPVLALKVSDMNRPGNETYLRTAAIEFTASSEFIGRHAVPPQSVVFPKRGAAIATNKKRLTTAPAVLDPNLIAVIPPVSVDAEFLFYWFLTFDLGSLQESGAVPQLNKKDLTPVSFPLPPLPEQRAIAAVLSKIQAVVEVQDKIVATLKELKAATMAKLFREGLRGEPLKQTEIGEIPESWEVVRAAEAVSIAEGQVDPKVEPYASMLHIGPESVEPGTGRLLKCRTARETGLISGKYLFNPGDIVYSKIRPYLRKAVLVDFVGLCSADMYPLTPADGFEPKYLHNLFLSEIVTRQAVAEQDRTGIPKVNRQQLNRIVIPKAPLWEQQSIGELLALIARRTGSAIRRRDALNSAFSTMLHLLMTGQVRVNQLASRQSQLS